MSEKGLTTKFVLWTVVSIAVGFGIGFMLSATEVGLSLTWVELIAVSAAAGVALGLIGYLCLRSRSRKLKD